MEILEVDKNRLIEEILKLCDGTMEFVAPIVSVKEALEGSISESPNQFIRIKIGDKELRIRLKKSEELWEAGLTQDSKDSKEINKGIVEVPTIPIINDDDRENDTNLRIFRSELSARILSCIKNGNKKTRSEIATALGYKTSNNIHGPLKRLEKAKLIKLGGRNGKIEVTERGIAFLEEYEKKNGKIELPKKIIVQEEKDEKTEERIKLSGSEKLEKRLSEKEKIAQIQAMKIQGELVSPETVSKRLGIGREEASSLIEKSEATI